MNLSHAFARIVALLSLALLNSIAAAASLTVQVTDLVGMALPDAVVYAEPVVAQAAPKAKRMVEVEQKGRKFSPLVTVIQSGTEVSFPNNDTVRHHVYSFSPAKIFDIKLYAAGQPGNPGPFDKAGTVVVGCNIHDQMVAYIHVVNTPWFAKTDAGGKVRIEGLPAGKYTLKAWHYNQPSGTPIAEQALTFGAGDESAAFKIKIINKVAPAAGY